MLGKLGSWLLVVLLCAACADASPGVTPPAATALPLPLATSAPTATPSATLVPTGTSTPTAAPTATSTATPTATPKPLNPLAIEAMRQKAYPGSDIIIEGNLPAGANYQRYYVSYMSDGLKIFAMMSVPTGPKPAAGWPVIIFNHGFIAPSVYKTTERYVAYFDYFARAGYIVIKSDYRGHDKSEGVASGGYGSPDYTVDVLNALASAKRYKDADPKRIGMWGHSMGGQATLRSIVVSKDIKAAVIWAGVVDSYPDMLVNWNGSGSAPAPSSSGLSRGWRGSLVRDYGTPQENPAFWASISPNNFLSEGVPPVQLHHGTADHSVPLRMSEDLTEQMKEAGQTVEFFTYPGDDHNIETYFGLAMSRSLAWFNKYVKGN
jgi:dipeptidyl aminopeptidase/acylaminoacyl peptidase